MVMWFDRRGRRKYDDLTTGKRGEPKIIRESPTYFARYRDADGVERIESTGCKDEQAARQVLADLVKRVEHRKAGILTPEQDRQADFANLPIADHITAYIEHLKAKTVRGKRVSAHHRRNVKHQLDRIVTECGFRRVGDISREAMETWMNRREADGMAGRTRNTYRAAIVAFCNWCVESGRLSFSPLARLHKADEHSDRRRVRRALTEKEVSRLLKAAEMRPIAELGRESIAKPASERKGRSTWTKAELTFETLDAAYTRGLDLLADQPKRIAQLTFLGRKRSLMYRMMICTGLRKSELASLTVGQVHLNRPHPCAELLAKDEKAGRGAMIPLRADLAEALRGYLDGLQVQSGAKMISHDTHLFPIPKDMIRVFDRDLAAASIPKRDPRGRVMDLHALRHTFGTHLARAGVAPRVAMAAMRHSSLELTMNVYTDPALLDVAGAVEALPAFSSPSGKSTDQPLIVAG
jgi:integrase